MRFRKLPAPSYIVFLYFLHPLLEFFCTCSIPYTGRHPVIILDALAQMLIRRADPVGFPAIRA